MSPKPLKFSASVLAGGQSSRMGFNKAFIKAGGETIISRAVRVLKEGFGEVNIIANDISLYEGLGVPVYPDTIKGAGSLGGIYTALIRSTAGAVFVAACDMPYLDLATVLKVTSSLEGYDSAVPFIKSRLHPLHAAYSKQCAGTIEEMIKAGDLRITGLFDRIKTRRLTEADLEGLPFELSVENVNTKEDLERVIDEPGGKGV